MVKIIIGWIVNTKVMAVSVILFAAAMAVATFVENDFGTAASKVVIYNAKWFELILFVLVVNFIGNIFRYRLFVKAKWPLLLFHCAFIVILIGAAITRYFSFEGMMRIKEGAVATSMYSDKTYVTLGVGDQEIQQAYESEVLFSQLASTNYHLKEKFVPETGNPIPFEARIVGFVSHAKETFQEDASGALFLHLVTTGDQAREDVFIKEGSVRSIHNKLFTLNKHVEGAMNFVHDGVTTKLQSPLDGTVMEMMTQRQTPVLKDSITTLQQRQLYSFGDLKFVISKVVRGSVQLSPAPKDQEQMYPFDVLTLLIRSGSIEQVVNIQGAKGIVASPVVVSVNGLNFSIAYGSKLVKIPFGIKLRDFELERYPGTNSASSYASEVTVIDEPNSFDFRIYMNHVLDYRGYRFFQSSYDPDETGTILSVNHDAWGTGITYLGYTLMTIGMFLSLFWNGTRFQYLSSLLKKSKPSIKILTLLFLGLVGTGWAQETSQERTEAKAVMRRHAEEFGRILIQDHQGRIKPVDTYALEALRKVYKKEQYDSLNAVQVLLSAQVNPGYWSHQNVIRVNPNMLGKELSEALKVSGKYTSLINFFRNGEYILQSKVNESFRKRKILRNATDNEIINLDERVNVWLNVLRGGSMNIYPKAGDPNNKWYLGTDQRVFAEQDTMVLKIHSIYMNALARAVETGDYQEADEFLKLIEQYQEKLGNAIIPPPQKVSAEIYYNRWSIFKTVMFYYMAIGLVMLIVAFWDLFKPNTRTIQIWMKVCQWLSIMGISLHAIGIGMRWYISGHEPWSNGYEAVVFVAMVTVVAGLIFSYKKSKFTLAATIIFASFLLGIAHGSLMNPEITNLVPVLKSYWLMIHVAVITSSYGFLGLGSLLGFIVLLLYIIRSKKNSDKLNHTIDELTRVNELTLTAGLYMLAVGTFLGGVWANESWGRYWSWDPKEVWALISVMVYMFILHMRIVPGLKDQFTFNVASLFSIATLIMTFFGVNYYLSGMHSYAAGDPVPIPIWIYFAVAFFVVFSVVSYWRYKSYRENEDQAPQ